MNLLVSTFQRLCVLKLYSWKSTFIIQLKAWLQTLDLKFPLQIGNQIIYYSINSNVNLSHFPFEETSQKASAKATSTLNTKVIFEIDIPWLEEITKEI